MSALENSLKIALLTKDKELAGWLELLFLENAEQVKDEIFFYYRLPDTPNTFQTIKYIENECPSGQYILVRGETPILARVPSESGLITTEDQAEIGKHYILTDD